MNKYEIVDNGVERYTVEASNAMRAVIKWMMIYGNPNVLDFIAEHGYEYALRLKITKLKED
jgi:hypothetical protein